ncbi:glycosyltransferase [Terrimonas sp. NA20]|uniref:Glycosyltransferase n=1 Tax=Terrimonas ginsenosidimutans TaxID=2908004 RepID=A0ABS9KM96_9BACT|nr:glycosyltransferase [Terrimonas ginsenosidimutans]MCG2613447.1 glycosyltransferase [Terrimonas ginsenosidimutans]
MNRPPKVSLIVATYNWPEALKLCLASIADQSVLPDEVIIADDGSTEETDQLIERMRPLLPIPVVHVWQEDKGFRLTKIRNKAIAKASYEYIIQVDGDLILQKHFVRDHLEVSRPGHFVAGSRTMINETLSKRLLQSGKHLLNPYRSGIGNRLNAIRNKIFRSRLTTRYKPGNLEKLRGCNMAFWKKDLIATNGYNEAFEGWGKEDNEIAYRLSNANITKLALKFGGVVYHLHHRENCRGLCQKNQALLQQTIESRITRCTLGLDQYLVKKPAVSSPLVSVVVVTLNAGRSLQRCIDSIHTQSYPALQLIVIDGGSADNTTAILEENSHRISYWTSERDGGVYDAMNKAIEKAEGEWIYFIGADDEMTPDFSKLASQLTDKNTIYYGSVWKEDKKYLGKMSAYAHAKTGINHQAMIYPSSVFRKYRYDTDYCISADHVLNMWCWKDPSIHFQFVDHVIANFSANGLSSKYKDQLFEKRKAALILRNYGPVIWSRFIFKQYKASKKLKRANQAADRQFIPANFFK